MHIAAAQDPPDTVIQTETGKKVEEASKEEQDKDKGRDIYNQP